jgi:putative membrane protein
MNLLAKILVSLVAIEHLYFLYLEMFAWTKPRTMKTFGNTQEFAEVSKVLAANQGLYNGFLAAGLIWGLLHSNPVTGFQIQMFFLVCVIVAAIYGGMTAKRSILFIQGLPALLALIILFLVRR